MRTRLIIFILIFSFSFLNAQERYIHTSDGVDLYVKTEGTGTPCLYIHGGPGSGSYWLEKFMGDYLEQHFQMIYLDQRGVGRSTSPADNNYSLKRMVADFEEVRKALGIDQWLTLGHSFGGILQMDYSLQYPQQVLGMICINCTLSLEDSFRKSWLPEAMKLVGDDVPAICRDESAPIYDRMLAIMPVLAEKNIMWKMFFSNEENSRKMNETYTKFPTWNSDQSEKILEFDDYWQDFSIYTPEVKQPVLFFYGKADRAVGPEHYKKAAFPEMILWGSEVGHMPFLENKADLEKAITFFVNKYSF